MEKLSNIAQAILRNLEKDLERNHVRLIGQISLQQTAMMQKKVKGNSNKEIKTAQKDIDNLMNELNEHIKGRFGKKVQTVLNQQKQLLDSL